MVYAASCCKTVVLLLLVHCFYCYYNRGRSMPVVQFILERTEDIMLSKMILALETKYQSNCSKAVLLMWILLPFYVLCLSCSLVCSLQLGKG